MTGPEVRNQEVSHEDVTAPLLTRMLKIKVYAFVFILIILKIVVSPPRGVPLLYTLKVACHIIDGIARQLVHNVC